ncbi:hypothetical protein [Sphingomonas hengshuiensis]|uniref:hypothetical protein n=1 Tax=Sphingomonas hengshuiensis TaxID=1609977 RepID=UPI000696D7D9|nr:hypothetical protein [Sphingomonas hengshuiensis]
MLAAPKRTQKFAGGGLLNVGVKASAVILQGGLVMLLSGYATPARAGAGGTDLLKIAEVANMRVVGMALASVTGTAADGGATIDVEEGTYLLKNSAGVDAITVADINRTCFVVDDETVASNAAGGTRPRAGVVREVTSAGVWVEISAAASAGAPRSVWLPFAINETDTLAGTSAELVAPGAGRIGRLSVVVQKAVTTGGDVTVAVGTTAVVGLTCTIADAATKGTVVTDAPTNGDATTIVAAGDRIQIIPAAAFNTAGAVSGLLEIILK